MFRDMRRKRQELSAQECADILARGEWGTLALAGDDGYPYAVPLNYVYLNGKLYFHSAKAGHKIDALKRSDKASFCVVGSSDLLPEQYATAYRSVVAFGRVRVVDDPGEFDAALAALVEALAGGEPEAAKHAEIARCHMHANVEVLALEPEHITGKQAKSLV